LKRNVPQDEDLGAEEELDVGEDVLYSADYLLLLLHKLVCLKLKLIHPWCLSGEIYSRRR
jgi:hypothetical protein